MLGNKEKHIAMWQYIIDKADELFDNKIARDFPNGKILLLKMEVCESNIKNYCYACEEVDGNCEECPIAHKAGVCYSGNDTYCNVAKALGNGDKATFIKEAERIRDAWE